MLQCVVYIYIYVFNDSIIGMFYYSIIYDDNTNYIIGVLSLCLMGCWMIGIME